MVFFLLGVSFCCEVPKLASVFACDSEASGLVLDVELELELELELERRMDWVMERRGLVRRAVRSMVMVYVDVLSLCLGVRVRPTFIELMGGSCFFIAPPICEADR